MESPVAWGPGPGEGEGEAIRRRARGRGSRGVGRGCVGSLGAREWRTWGEGKSKETRRRKKSWTWSNEVVMSSPKVGASIHEISAHERPSRVQLDPT